MDTGNMIAMGALALSTIIAICGCLRFVTSSADAVRKECADTLKEGLKGEAHSRNNALQPIGAWLQRTEANLSALERDAARRTDLAQFEGRLARFDTKLDAIGDKLDARFDAVLARISQGRA